MTLQVLGEEGPFQPPADGGGRKPGPLLIGCGVFLALIGVAILLFMIRGEAWVRGILAWSLGTVEEQVATAYPEELSAQERARLRSAFEAARVSIREAEQIDVEALQALQPVMLEVSRAIAADGLTRRQCLEMAAALERVAASSSGRGERSKPLETEAPVPDSG